MKKLLFLLVCSILVVSCNLKEKQQKTIDSIEKASYDSINKLKVDSTNKLDSIKKVYAEIYRTNTIKNSINAIKNSIRITSFYSSEPNSAGGCDVHLTFINKSNKIIKYVDWEGSFKNAVGDLVTSEIGNKSIFEGRFTGPVKPEHNSHNGYWSCIIYNFSAKRVIMNNLNIEYMDGSTIMIKGKDLKTIGLKDKQINI
jgi:hypothetical protein